MSSEIFSILSAWISYRASLILHLGDSHSSYSTPSSLSGLDVWCHQFNATSNAYTEGLNGLGPRPHFAGGTAAARAPRTSWAGAQPIFHLRTPSPFNQLPKFSKTTPPASFLSTSTTMLSEAYLARELRLTKAMDALRTNEYSIVAQCAVAFDVPRRTLNNRWNGMASKSTRIPAKRCLTNEQEWSIVDYITRNYQRGMSLTLKHVEDAANYILQVGGGGSPA